jgi:hypothetical protein
MWGRSTPIWCSRRDPDPKATDPKALPEAILDRRIGLPSSSA